jgi:hypothetical protein
VRGEWYGDGAMDGGGVSFGVTGTLEEENGTEALLLLTCLGVPGQISHLNGIDPGLLHESSSIAAAIAECSLLVVKQLDLMSYCTTIMETNPYL